MDTDLATSLAMARTAATRASAQLAIVKTNHEAEQALVQMIAEAARAAPPPGQGTRIDKLA